MTVALIIGGGRSKRMGTNKGELTLEGRTLLERAVDAVTDASLAIVVAQEVELTPAPRWPEVRFTLENPPFGGPVAGIAAGVAQLSDRSDAEEVIVLPVDAPSVSDAAGELGAARPGPDGVVLQDQQGWPQYLFGRYRLGSLRRALGELGRVRGASVRSFGELLNVARVVVDHDLIADVDTPEQAIEAGIDLPRERRDDPGVVERVHNWRDILAGELGISDAPFDIDQILKLAAIVSKDVARPAVPVTAYGIGVAVGMALGRGKDADAALARAIDIATAPGNTDPARRPHTGA
ncbi:molybdenum cofactor guanylyltransferase [Tessaracoccus rhinocerotis]|uniref:Molybdenum cofactor guanylyltransferase n=1 Tax=Tessaracoccus rhinocerotis TaxID=1689449 RepID=A0A553JWQ8_9ACTN|nr:NTP transferase domain-containing protein [Tessaracoccus rhinocerotis]TRY16899.1 molybdenum cofactor guanylyltransferase [Tessaracoccus rhinocerotis]